MKRIDGVASLAVLCSLLGGSAGAAPSVAVAKIAPPSTTPAATPPRPAGDDRCESCEPGGEVDDHGRRANISANPLGWVLGIYGVSGTVALSQHVALRADVTYYAFIESDDHGHEWTVGLPLYLNRVYRGPFLEPGVMAIRLDAPENELSGELAGPQILVGWHWMWRGLNMAIAGGAARDLTGGYRGVFPNGYLRFGYAF